MLSLLKSTFLSSVLLVTALAAAQVAVPPLKARVTDLTGTLTSEQRSALEQTLAEFEKRKGAQIAVLMLPSTKPEEIEPFAVRVQEAWKLGRKGVDDGVLLVVAKDDRRLKIETGYGLEGVLPDAIAKRIIDQDITPRFKQGDFYGGIRAGTDRLMRVIEGEALPAPGRAGESSQLSVHMDWIIPALILVMVVGGVLRSIFGRFVGSGLIGAVAGGLAWFIVGSLVIALLVALAAFVFQLAGGSGMGSRRRGGGGGLGGGWSSGGGGFGGAGGGFGGGGGSSGGGGASGSW